jgi:hypothetical protein
MLRLFGAVHQFESLVAGVWQFGHGRDQAALWEVWFVRPERIVCNCDTPRIYRPVCKNILTMRTAEDPLRHGVAFSGWYANLAIGTRLQIS